MKLTNTTEHARISFIASIMTGFLLLMLHMEKLWLATIISFGTLLLGFELGQWAANGFSKAYLKEKWLDCLLDIAVGLVSFAVPITILCYALAHVK